MQAGWKWKLSCYRTCLRWVDILYSSDNCRLVYYNPALLTSNLRLWISSTDHNLRKRDCVQLIAMLSAGRTGKRTWNCYVLFFVDFTVYHVVFIHGCEITQLLWWLAGVSTTTLPSHLSNLRATHLFPIPTTRNRDFTTFTDNISCHWVKGCPRNVLDYWSRVNQSWYFNQTVRTSITGLGATSITR